MVGGGAPQRRRRCTAVGLSPESDPGDATGVGFARGGPLVIYTVAVKSGKPAQSSEKSCHHLWREPCRDPACLGALL